MKIAHVAVLMLAALLTSPAAAQGKPPADSMQVLREKLMSDKKQVVASSMSLTDAEAKGFWPVYEDYQKELQKINERTAMMVVSYAKDYNASGLANEKAKSLLDRYFAIEESEIKLKRAFVPRLEKVLPGQKVARYMQIENKIRALVKYELAAEVPLVP